MQERWRSWSVVWTCRVQASFHAPSVTLEWAATTSVAMAASIGCTKNAVGSSAWQRTLTTDSFLLLPRRHALSSRWLWTLNHNACENCLEDVAMCTALVCGVQCFMPVRLGHWQSQTSSIHSGMIGQWSDRSAMSGRKTLSPPGPMSYLRDLALRIWTSFWRREGSAGTDMWNAPMVQSRQPFTYRLRKSMVLGGPRWLRI